MLAALTAGCSSAPGDRPKTVPVRGLVTYKGEPLAGARVNFFNPAANRSAIGETGPDGRFTLTTFEKGDGAVPGPQQVTVRKIEVIDRSKPGYDYVEKGETAPPPEEKWHTPKRYGSAAESGLSAVVTEAGPNDFTFDLKE
ncbi:MAG: hypothetical protein C0501_03620 [Isosphaera sp.]|nr:hypothetical protein [Isosphaera sp.]